MTTYSGTAYTTVTSQTVSVDANKTGLYNLAFNSTAQVGSTTFLRYLVDGQAVDPVGSGYNVLQHPGTQNATLALTRQLTLSPGSHTVAVQAYDDAGSLTLRGYEMNLTGFNNLTPVPEPATWAVTAIGAVGLAGWSRLRRR